MDQNANLAEQLRIVARINAARDADDGENMGDVVEDACRLAELIESLHKWIKGGGALPKAWAR